jgi:integrase
VAWVRARKLKTGVHYYAIEGGRSRALGPDYVPSPTPGTLAHMAERDQLLNPEPTRRKVWRRILARLGGNTKAVLINRAKVEDYRAGRLKEGVSPSTVNRETAMLSAGFRDQQDFNPCAGLKRLKETPRRGTALTPEEVGRLLGILRGISAGTALLAEFLYLTGSRFSERGVVEGGGYLRFPPSKRGRARNFKIEGRLAEIVPEMGRIVPKMGACDPLRWSRDAWDKAVIAFGKHVTPKDLRHSAVTNLLEEGASIPDAQRMTGHTTPQMIHQTYAHLRPVAARGPKSPAVPLDPAQSPPSGTTTVPKRLAGVAEWQTQGTQNPDHMAHPYMPE